MFMQGRDLRKMGAVWSSGNTLRFFYNAKLAFEA
jgi:hypothetical protein